MRKFTLLLLAVMAGMGTASANGEMWLRSNVGSWTDNLSEWQFSKQWDGSQDVYELTIPASKLVDANSHQAVDLYFRLFRDGNNYETCPWGNQNYTYKFENGQNETYNATSGSEFQGTSGAYCIQHTAIKASEYKITVYVKYEDPWKYYIKADIVSMPASIGTLGYATFSCDRALDFTGIADLTAYKASVNNEGKVVLTKVDGKVAAGTGLLLAGSSADIPVVSATEGVEITDNLLKGCTTEQTIVASTAGAYHYFLAGTDAESLGFYNLASDAICAAGKAYLETSTELANEAGSARVAWIFQDDATAINAVENAQNAETVYDLQGRVAKTAKAGLYIKNGKKFIVK